MVTMGNVTQGQVTGAQTCIKQSFSDLTQVFDPHVLNYQHQQPSLQSTDGIEICQDMEILDGQSLAPHSQHT